MVSFRKRIGFLLVCTLFSISASNAKKIEIKVLQFNIWQEGTSVPGGYEAIVNEISRLKPDFVTLSEIRNYNNTRFCERIVASLKEKGEEYYSFYSDDSGLLSRFPIQDSTKVFPDAGSKGGTIHKLIATIQGIEIAVYTAHLDYTHYAPYLPRGYDGATWKKLPNPVTSVDSVLISNQTSLRDEGVMTFIAASKEDIASNRLVFIGGDFNEPSDLDWTKETVHSADHKGLVIPWLSTSLLEKTGYIDSYRKLYPNPVTHPGYTYPADCQAVGISKLAWAPDADDRDRIDYIFYYPDKRLSLKKSIIVGPKGSIVRNQRVVEHTKDKFIEPESTWPTDHKALLSTFIINTGSK